MDNKQLKTKKKNLKTQLSKFRKYVDKFDSDSQRLTELKERLIKIEDAWNQFDTVQSQCEEMEGADEEALENERSDYEEAYFAAVGLAKEHIELAKVAMRLETPPASPALSSEPAVAPNVTSKVQLPVLTLPKFSGSYTEWLLFKDTFSSAIHNNETLTNVEKFRYLRSVLLGEAFQLLSALQTTNENYIIAWDLLLERYENTRIIVHNHVKGLFDIPPIIKENTSAYRQTIDQFQMHVRALQALKEPVDKWDTILIYMLTGKLDSRTKREWEAEVGNNGIKEKGKQTLQDLIKFLSNKCQILEITERTTRVAVDKGINVKKYSSFATTTSNVCVVCKENHNIFNCDTLLKLSPAERLTKIKELHLCINCLKIGHYIRECLSSTRCRKCKGKHNTLVHIPKNSFVKREENVIKENKSNDSQLVDSVANKPVNCFVQKGVGEILLSTAILNVYDNNGELHEARALLDSGSQVSFITKSLIDKLNLKLNSMELPIQGISGSGMRISHSSKVKIKSNYNNFNAILNCLVLNKITQPLPQTELKVNNLNIPNVKLADPNFYTPREVDMLLGADIFWELLCVGQIKLLNGQPTLQKTHFGWIISGPLQCIDRKKAATRICSHATISLENKLERFWKIEEVVSDSSNHNLEELQCEEVYTKTITRTEQGRFVVGLPQKETVTLGNSLSGALKRLYYLEKRFSNNKELQDEYIKFMKCYEELGHMSEICKEELDNQECFYLPHHAVVKSDSLTTKLRVVFDGSFKTSNGISLNDKLLVGPTIQDELFKIILRFRMHNYVITADITMMFRQILVRSEDRRLQRICWRESTAKPVKYYSLNTITYGTASAPFLATRTLKQLAHENGSEFPNAKQVLECDFYMDDVLSGARTKEEAITLQKELTELLLKGGFSLRKWRANDPDILKHLQNEARSDELLIIDKSETSKTLGLLWNSATDAIEYSIKEYEKYKRSKVTKRTILSRTATIFDPLGLVGPVIIVAKRVLQELWQLKIEWDESVPQSIHTIWQDLMLSLNQLNYLSIDRNVNPDNVTGEILIHGFCDASEKAYGACIYITSTDTNGQINTRLLCAKSKVAPLKVISLPRLELCGALTLARLVEVVQQSLRTKLNHTYLWSDSTIVLAWLKMQPSQLKTFVGNRVAEIQRLTATSTWQHVNSAENPADIISRGMTAEQLLHSELWWHGPRWLHTNHWPSQKEEQEFETNEERKIVTLSHLVMTFECDLLRKYSTFNKLQRVIAYCMRYKDKVKAKYIIHSNELSIEELNRATIKIIQLTQREVFPQEIKELETTRILNNKSKLLNLNPFLDSNGLIRVGGRLEKAEIPFNQKHPYILPQSHHVTTLIARDIHEKMLHCGQEHLLSTIRRNYWPIAGRRLAKKIVHNCIKCFKFKPRQLNPIMGDLPKPRVCQTNRPFMVTGIDYAGPVQIKESKRRGRPITSKAYVAVFVCFNTKAVHLELITDLTTEAFLAALKRFCARRGLCAEIYTDNATNFKGADLKLKEVYEFLSKRTSDISMELAKQKIAWHFIPPRSPNFGGLWEAAVKAMKTHFLKVTNNIILTYEQCYTLLTTIEAILNSRPLTPMSSNPNDLQPITPSHFLIGDLLLQPVEGDYTSIPSNRLSTWEHLQKMRQHFWQRWKHEYLHQLQVRQKWHRQHPNLQVGDLVILMEDNSPPMKWTTGRVIETHPGQDQVIRVVTVKCANGTYKRPVRKLCLVPV